MQQSISLQLLPSQAATYEAVKEEIAKKLNCLPQSITGFYTEKKSIDARSKTIRINLTVKVYIGEPFFDRPVSKVVFQDVSKASRRVIIVGAGPAGLFAALKLIEEGIQPILLERGRDVRSRRRDLAMLNRDGEV